MYTRGLKLVVNIKLGGKSKATFFKIKLCIAPALTQYETESNLSQFDSVEKNDNEN